MRDLIIAIDGFSFTGKSTLAKLLAESFLINFRVQNSECRKRL